MKLKRSTAWLLGGLAFLVLGLAGAAVWARVGLDRILALESAALADWDKPEFKGKSLVRLDEAGKDPQWFPSEDGAAIELPVGLLRKLSLSGNWELVVRQGDTSRARVSLPAGSRGLALIELKDGGLSARQHQGPGIGWPHGSPRLEVELPRLESLELAGATDCRLESISADELSIELAGSCSLTGTGKAQALRIQASGAFSAELEALVSQSAVVEGAGSGSLHLRVESGTVSGSLSGMVQLELSGKPGSVQVNTSGMSQVKQG